MRTAKVIKFALFLVLLGINSDALEAQPLTALDQLTRESSYIFLGTVTRAKASTSSLLPANDSTIVVRVDVVLHAPETLADYTGQELTILLREIKSVKEGQRLVFFTNGGLFGKGIALREVGHLVPPAGTADQTKLLRAQIADALQKKTDEDVGRRIASAELVVVGKVLETRLAKPMERSPVTEHDPEWREADIQIQSVEKGQYSGQTINVLYANSLDSLWAEAPKLKQGQQGIFLLHRNEVQWPGIEKFYALVNPLDLQPIGRLERVRQILKGGL
jgi:hypothetical protein